jgi:CBS domain-containing protein
MQIKEIMRPICVVDKNIELDEAAKLMVAKGIGSLVFILKNRIVGIITERDLVKYFGKKKKVYDIMAKTVVTVDKEDSLDRAIELMRDNKIKRLPVLDKDKLVGIVTLTDIAANADYLEEEFFFE